MTTKNVKLFGDKNPTEYWHHMSPKHRQQQQVDKCNPTLKEVIEKNEQVDDPSRLLMDVINTDYLD